MGRQGGPKGGTTPKRGPKQKKEEANCAPPLDFAAAFLLLEQTDAEPGELTACLSALCAAAKTRAARERIDGACSDRAALYRCLSADEPKLRKNAARLLGALGRGRDAAALAAALAAERRLFVVPSILLALGRCGGSTAQSAVAAYAPPRPRDETEEKHVREIQCALEKAKNSFETGEFPALSRLPAPQELLLLPPDGFSAQLFEELEELGFSPRPAGTSAFYRGGLLVKTDDIEGIYRARCAAEILLPVAEGVAFTPEAVAAAFAPAPEHPYRLELRGWDGNRAAFLRETARLLGGRNNPSHYALELRIERRDDGRAALFQRPCNVLDTRFAYRRQALPASIHPVTAACLVRYGRRFRPAGKEAPSVLDPCCGSGTLLFEREKLSPCGSLLGVELTGRGVLAAKENAAAGRSRARFIQKDCLNFTPRAPVDELYANLPFGNRVGSHTDNEALYRGLAARLPDWLSEDGIALLYTMEHRLLQRCLREEPRLTLLGRTRTEAGGLMPQVFVLAKKGRG